jgi:hypothetical protein
MASFKSWIKKAVENLIDPDKEERLEYLTRLMHDGLRKQGAKFSLSKAIEGQGHDLKDVAMAKERVYRTILTRGWRDEKLTKEEQGVVRWVARSLEIPELEARQINLGFALDRFAAALAEAMEDGVLEEHEEQRLEQIAQSVGYTMADFVRQFFRAKGEAFLRGVFLACVADNHISPDEWETLLRTTGRLGLSREEMLQAILPQSEQFVEHVLADAKADGRLSAAEERTLDWLLSNLMLTSQYRCYVEQEIHLLRQLTAIEDGKLPSIGSPQGIETRAGEIVHFHGPAIWRQVRMLASGPRTDEHRGTVTFTDNRLIFSSPTKSQSIGYRRIVAHHGGSDWLEVQVEGKPKSTFLLPQGNPVGYPILRSAIAMANQTVVARATGAPTGQIPREVRQRAWQRYGGRCAECGATDYLEFDHIIPRAKGGSNSDANVQLLCRRCNLRKSDHI